MTVDILPGKEEHVSCCVNALLESRIGAIYFQTDQRATAYITSGMTKKEIVVAMDDTGVCTGFVWFSLTGAFYSFPYIRTIAVASAHRQKGIGSALVRYFEQEGFKVASKVFLLVSDFNTDARHFYEKNGYQTVGTIPDLIKPGIAEIVLMKSKI